MRFWKKILKTSAVIFGAILLATVGINASDNIGNMSSSLLGGVVGGNEGACAKGMVFVSTSSGGFCIDKYEASPSSECPNKNPRNQSETQFNMDQPDCYAVSEKDTLPWSNISQAQAAGVCRKSGKRLPTNKEWYEAALGLSDPDSEWGDNGCNLGNPSTDVPANTGSRSECVSPVGAYDMIGNVWEWVDGTVVDGKHEGTALPEQGYVSSIDSNGVPIETGEDANSLYNEDYLWINKEGARGMYRGGYWGNNERAGIYSIYAYSSPSFFGKAVGFRCVK